MKLGKILKRATHSVWIQMQESGAIRTGQTIELDPRDTGDNYSPSPAVREVYRADYESTTTTEVHESRRA